MREVIFSLAPRFLAPLVIGFVLPGVILLEFILPGLIFLGLILLGLSGGATLAAERAVDKTERADQAVAQVLDRIVAREALFLQTVRTHAPLIETYIQETSATKEGETHPVKDHYFLGRFRLDSGLDYEPLLERTDAVPKPGRRGLFRPAPPKGPSLTFLARGFAQMTALDLQEFNRQTYRFEYVRREFLGEVRCLVFDVAPVMRNQPGKFIGRIWVEDRDYAIVHFNGTYVPAPIPKGGNPELYFHFDSWRMNIGGAVWVPAQVYVEEEGTVTADGRKELPRFKAQSRIWDYEAAPSSKMEELASILIEGDKGTAEQMTPDASPLESQRNWEKQAEENLLARLEKGGLLAPPGPVEAVLDTVVNNLIIAGHLNIEAHCRVLLTTPMETFAIGHAIVISRGLIDVLPDESSLALLLSAELSHIALGHRTQTQFAFNNQTMLSDAELLQRFRFARPADEMISASTKTIEIMKASPYQNTSNSGLFLKELAAHSQLLPMLLRPNLGDQVSDDQALARLQQFAAAAPPLEQSKLEQIAALPLGSRIKLNSWNNKIELVKSRPISLLSAREKMPFEVTPFVLNLTRADLSSRTDSAKEPVAPSSSVRNHSEPATVVSPDLISPDPISVDGRPQPNISRPAVQQPVRERPTTEQPEMEQPNREQPKMELPKMELPPVEHPTTADARERPRLKDVLKYLPAGAGR